MKKLLIVLLGVTTLLSCNEDADTIGQIPLDSIAPGKVSNVEVENGPGSAKLTYTIPADDDLLYVKVSYNVNDEITRESIASYYNNELLLEGFGEVKPYTVSLVAVDQSQNESAAVEVVVNPEQAPVHTAFASLSAIATFGGIYMEWQNEYEKDLNIEIDVNDLGNEGNFVEETVLYTKEPEGKQSIRGFAPESRTFKFTISDRWGNRSETLEVELTPILEIEADKTEWVIEHNFKEYPNTTWRKNKVHDGIIGNNGVIANDANADRPHLTIDLGRTFRLSRMIQWQRLHTNYTFKHLNTKEFIIWGSNNPSTDLNDYSTWTLITEDIVDKPSGNDNSGVTAADRLYANGGHTTDFDITTPSYRYIRYELVLNWSNNTRFQLGEISIFGQYVD